MWIRCGSWKTLTICSSTYNQSPSPSTVALKHLTSLPSTQLFLTNSIKAFDFSTLYTTIPHSKLTERLKVLVHKKNGQRTYKYLVRGSDKSCFVKQKCSDSTKKFPETDIIKMLEFFNGNIFVMFGGHVFQHSYGCQLCSSSHRLVPLCVWDRLDTGVCQEKRKESNPIL